MLTSASRRLVSRPATSRCIAGPNATANRPHRRVLLTKASKKSTPGSPQHVRFYQSTLRKPYFSNTVVELVEETASDTISWWQRAFKWYSKKLSTHPLITKSLTGAIIAAAGDVMCQAGTFVPEEEDYNTSKGAKKKQTFWDAWDAKRSFNFFLLGFVFVAPTSHYWYGGLAKHPWTKGQSFVPITKRVILDQFVWSPVFFVIWLSSFWALQQEQPEAADGNDHHVVDVNKIKKQLVEQFPDVMIANWMLWIPAQYLNFYACPVKFQVLFTNVVELVWNAYLSFAAGDGAHGHDQSSKKKQGSVAEGKKESHSVSFKEDVERGCVEAEDGQLVAKELLEQ